MTSLEAEWTREGRRLTSGTFAITSSSGPTFTLTDDGRWIADFATEELAKGGARVEQLRANARLPENAGKHTAACKHCGGTIGRRYPGGDPENGPATMDCVLDCATRARESECPGPDEGDGENGPPDSIEPCCARHFPDAPYWEPEWANGYRESPFPRAGYANLRRIEGIKLSKYVRQFVTPKTPQLRPAGRGSNGGIAR